MIDAPGRHRRVSEAWGHETPAVEQMLGDKPKVREASKPAIVLVVDDDDQVRSVVVRLVQHLGFTPAPAPSAEAALAISPEPSALALLITDLHLPAMSGVDLITRLRERSSDLPAILISGDLTPDACARARLLGGVELVAKPFGLGELSALVERVGCRALPRPPE